MPARVPAIHLSPAATVLPHAADEAQAQPHRGLVGDRYFECCGTFTNAEPKGPGREFTQFSIILLFQSVKACVAD